MLFFPGIIEQGASSYRNATDQTQQTFLDRWLLLTAAMVALSALLYAARLAYTRRPETAAPAPSAADNPAPADDDH